MWKRPLVCKVCWLSSSGIPGRKAYNILASTPEQAKETAYGFIDRSDTEYDLVLLDLPGTVNTTGVFQSIINMDYVFTPITQERMVMQSSMSFVLSIREYLLHHKGVPLRDIHMFWNKMDKRCLRTCMTLIWKSSVLWDYLY